MMSIEYFSPATRNMIHNISVRYPVLEQVQEVNLFMDWRENHNVKSRDKLILSHIHIIAKMVYNMVGYGLPLDDLLNQAIQGITKAVDRFEPERGFRFITFARNWITASLTNYVMDNKQAIKGPQSDVGKMMFFHLNSIKNKLCIQGALTKNDAENIRQTLLIKLPNAKNIPLTVQSIMENDAYLNAQIISADATKNDEETNLLDSIADPSESIEYEIIEGNKTNIQSSMLTQAINNTLNLRQKHIFTARRLIDQAIPQIQIAKELGISKQRVDQIEKQAYELVKAEMLALKMDMQMDALRRNEKYSKELKEKKRSRRSKNTSNYDNEHVVKNTNIVYKSIQISKSVNQGHQITNFIKSLTAEQRSEISRKANASRSPEYRREISLRAAATRRATKQVSFVARDSHRG